MAIGTVIARMDDRLAAFRAAIVAAGSPLAARVHKPNLMHYTAHSEAELTQGVIISVSAGEGNYHQASEGMIAKEGTHRVLLIGHCRVAETATPSAIEALEINMIEEVKAFLRLPIPGMSLNLESVEHSRQLELPYGWFVAFIELLPPRTNVY
jgi:hypothetical protein